jgi:hypothetical protein
MRFRSRPASDGPLESLKSRPGGTPQSHGEFFAITAIPKEGIGTKMF